MRNGQVGFACDLHVRPMWVRLRVDGLTGQLRKSPLLGLFYSTARLRADKVGDVDPDVGYRDDQYPLQWRVQP